MRVLHRTRTPKTGFFATPSNPERERKNTREEVAKNPFDEEGERLGRAFEIFKLSGLNRRQSALSQVQIDFPVVAGGLDRNIAGFADGLAPAFSLSGSLGFELFQNKFAASVCMFKLDRPRLSNLAGFTVFFRQSGIVKQYERELARSA